MEFLIISGMSGAGKSRAADVMEDLNYYCVDNLPVALIPRFAELCMATQERYEKVALVMDVRERDGFEDLFSTLDSLKNMGCTYRMLFMDADTATLIKRYKERDDDSHPGTGGLRDQFHRAYTWHASAAPVFTVWRRSEQKNDHRQCYGIRIQTRDPTGCGSCFGCPIPSEPLL